MVIYSYIACSEAGDIDTAFLALIALSIGPLISQSILITHFLFPLQLLLLMPPQLQSSQLAVLFLNFEF